MLSKLFAALSSFFASLFGTKRSSTSTSPTDSEESGGNATTRPTSNPSPSRPTSSPPMMDEPQDASELQPDTVIIVAHEMEEVILVPGETDEDFDEDIFIDNPADNEPAAPAPDPIPNSSPAPAPVGRQPRYLWCLDNGHGSKTAGKRSPIFDDGVTQLLEYRFNRDIVRRITEKLDEEGILYFNVVPEVDVDNILQERVKRANSKQSDLPKIFLSIHSNAGPAKSSRHWTTDSIKGIETWFYHGSKKGQRLAAVFQRHLIDFTGFNNRHLKSRPERQFYVLRKTRMPAVLTENGFYNNRAEALSLMEEEVRQQIADAHVAAIIEVEENGI